jgi:hypothetical protein
MRLGRECWRRWGLARMDLCGCTALGFKGQAATKHDCLLAGRGPPVSLSDSYIEHKPTPRSARSILHGLECGNSLFSWAILYCLLP